MSLVSYDSSDSDEEYEKTIATKSTPNEKLFQHARRIPEGKRIYEERENNLLLNMDDKIHQNVNREKDDANRDKGSPSKHFSGPVMLNEILPDPHHGRNILPKKSKRSDIEAEVVYGSEKPNVDDTSAADLQFDANNVNTDSISLFNVSAPYKESREGYTSDEQNYEPVFVKPQRKKQRVSTQSLKEGDITSLQPFSHTRDTEKPPSSEADIIEGRRKEKVRLIDVDMNQLPTVDPQEATSVTPSIKSVAPGRHQLSSLVGMAVSQKESFETYFEQQRANKKASSKSYGF
ncbi:complexed with Cdc5 protein Cwf20 [Schizosaccharomyces octosporus yFS286]|uniref:Complexed with Cdc5 protein Cwf20 n=1 Tax=Schizosaccharomyces octosporus (strain yFS286) TaxID=483514 RepID=S9PNV0_SCHOY|nr:complexed with Cdc5 protein Cwf20 [Schizosaccharomyces octosporus yFS286]EPX70931.1 complexed with Cdc5 protein Cwf20 [Schizosaccharomyces octosporus yFS286]